MRRLFTLSFAFVLFAAVAALAQPKLEFIGGDTYDWGEVTPQNSPLQATVQVKNTGNEVLKIEQVKPTCGCTIADISKKELKPNETAEFGITLNMKTYQGSVTKTIKVISNDPDKKNARYFLKCYVKQPLIANPKFVNFRGLEVGQIAVAHTTISNTTDKPIRILDVTLSRPIENFEVNIQKGVTIPPKGKINVEATYTPDNDDRLSTTIKLKTDSKDQPLFRLSVWGHHNKANDHKRVRK